MNAKEKVLIHLHPHFKVKYREFGKTGIKVSSIGIGTYYDMRWVVGSRFGIRPDYEMKIRAIRSGIEAGVNLIDTAELYNTERMVARAINGMEREDLFIATKVSPQHLGYSSLKKACHRSLSNLGTKYIDLYQIHFPNPFINMRDTARAMEELVDEGCIRNIGISNFSFDRMKEFMSSLKKYTLASTQMKYNLIDRTIEKDIIPFAQKEGISILAWFPLGHGKLVSKDFYGEKIMETIQKDHPGITPAQIALSYLSSKFSNVFPIPRASNTDHTIENAKAGDIVLSDDEIRILESLKF